jgi:hypothetical protein
LHNVFPIAQFCSLFGLIYTACLIFMLVVMIRIVDCLLMKLKCDLLAQFRRDETLESHFTIL